MCVCEMELYQHFISICIVYVDMQTVYANKVWCDFSEQIVQKQHTLHHLEREKLLKKRPSLLELLLTNIQTPNPFISINGALSIHLLPENLARRNTCVLVKQEASSPPHSAAQR